MAILQGDPDTLTYHAGGTLRVLDLPIDVTTGRLERRWDLLRTLDSAGAADRGTDTAHSCAWLHMQRRLRDPGRVDQRRLLRLCKL